MAPVEARYGAPWWYFSRQDIHTELKRAALSPKGLGMPAKLLLGAGIEHVDLESNTVHLRDKRTFHGDVIIGADGIRSPSGTSVFGSLPYEKTGFSAYRFMVPSQPIRDDVDTAQFVDCAKVIMILHGAYRIVIYPCAGWETLNFACIFPDDIERRHQWDTKVSVDDLVETFKHLHPAVVKMLSMAEDVGVWALRDREPLSQIVKGRFSLIGDAAHAMLPHQGQGACQAIEDAEALRVLLKHALRDEVEDRLSMYNALRVGRVRRVIENSRAMAPKRESEGPGQPDKSFSRECADYHWNYNVTTEAAKVLEQNGIKHVMVNESTGAVSLL
ncbi:salicylate hydroxylase [Colletotrichum spaethianum]|uniref:Salicylate hydroxylase n=1 Tax=Colletotrichum spaethianum TaxID=700344 RepID=A0AA37LKP6_9PEZI|nr:salicylate hydroxylase [Colletotrichum spaethianum]GKT46107.1 salicylate hydroxylase [Colletotrichum spaethianum]